MITNKGSLTEMELWGLSGDEKPVEKWKNTSIPNGSLFVEIDTGNAYAYDKDGERWVAQ